MIELMPYTVPNFWTERNSAAKRRQMERRGMPELEGGRFVTVTIDRRTQRTPSGSIMELTEEEAYALGKDRLRRFIANLKRRYKIRRWFWKMELHKPDELGRQYPHWHFWFDYGGHIPGEQLTKAWSLGRTDIRRVNRQEWKYLFKYMCKQAGDLPDWLTSKTKVRLFQTSMGFFAGNDATDDETPSPRQSDGNEAETQNDSMRYTDTIGERIVRWTRCVVARSTSSDGTFRHKLLVMRTTKWGELLAEFAQIRFRNGISLKDLNITTYKIETTWLTAIPPCLRASM